MAVPPEAFTPGAAIEVVDMSWNKISTLPDDFQTFVNLRRLSVNHNCLNGVGLGKGEFSQVPAISSM